MSDNDSDGAQEQVATSVLSITFKAPGSSEFQVSGHNVSPAQQLLAGTWLQVHAQYMMEQTWNQQLADAMRAEMQEEAVIRKVLRTKQ